MPIGRCRSSHPHSCLTRCRALTFIASRGRCSSCITSRRRSKNPPERKVPLQSGGHLIIDQTEAMTTALTSTPGRSSATAISRRPFFATNLESAVTIARQLRLRNLGGIIIIDFIDMEEPEHRLQVIQALERALSEDHVKTNISSVSPLGLVEMTRKRTRESLEHLLCRSCPTCEGRGFVKTVETVLLRNISRDRAPVAAVRVPAIDGSGASGRD